MIEKHRCDSAMFSHGFPAWLGAADATRAGSSCPRLQAHQRVVKTPSGLWRDMETSSEKRNKVKVERSVWRRFAFVKRFFRGCQIQTALPFGIHSNRLALNRRMDYRVASRNDEGGRLLQW
jgi:hypothetical protein